MAKIDDAYDRLSSAQKLVESGDYAGAITEAQMCIELSLKASLNALGVDYTTDDRGKKRFLTIGAMPSLRKIMEVNGDAQGSDFRASGAIGGATAAARTTETRQPIE